MTVAFVASIPSPSSGALTVGPLSIHAYGLMIALGVIAGVWLLGRRLEVRGEGTREDASAIAVWAVIAGVIGSRLYHVVTDWSTFEHDLGRIPQLWRGGLGIPGGILFGALAATWAFKRRGIPPAVGLSAAAPSLALAQSITETLGIVGLLAVELFITTDGRLFVNELAPRPHNTFHQTERGASVSQFEQLVRAVCGLPLEEPTTLVPAAIHNLLGDCWAGGPPDFTRAWALPGVRVHLYGKPVARAGRKMGHLSAVAPTPEAARDLVRTAYAVLTARGASPPR